MIDGLKPYPEMKDSGVPSIGEIPAHWEVGSLGRLGQISKGRGASKDDEVSEGIPCVRYGDLYTRHEYFIEEARSFVSAERASAYTPVHRGDVLFAGSGETIADIGKSAVNLLDAAVCGGDVLIFRPSREFVPRFLGYACDSRPAIEQKARMGRGFTVVHMYGDELKGLTIPVPPLAEQETIVRFLDHMDIRIGRLIRAKLRLVALMEEQKQAIIHKAVTRGLDPNAPLEPSGIDWLGDIPMHWTMVRLRFLIEEPLSYGAGAAAEHSNRDWPRYLRITDFRTDGTLRDETFRSLPPEEAKEYVVNAGDLLLARSGATVGKAYLVPTEAEGSCYAGYLIRARPRRQVIDPEFLFAFTQSSCFGRWRDTILTLATIPNISASKYASVFVPVPPREEQGEICSDLRQTMKVATASKNRISKEIVVALELRRRLVSDAITGRLDVRASTIQQGDSLTSADINGVGTITSLASPQELPGEFDP